MTVTAPLEKGILSVRELLGDGRLEIPVYQRPYKWAAKNIGSSSLQVVFFKIEFREFQRNHSINILNGISAYTGDRVGRSLLV